MNTTVLFAILASNVASVVAGIVLHAWSARQKSPTLTLDAIKGASALLAAAAKSAADDVTAASERQQAIDLALAHAAARLAPAATPVAPAVA